MEKNLFSDLGHKRTRKDRFYEQVVLRGIFFGLVRFEIYILDLVR